MDHFLEGYQRIIPNDVPVQYLASRKHKQENLEVFHSAETVIIIFPLYTDSMPGIVKEFFEEIAKTGDAKPKNIGFIVQSGFPEAIHAAFVERYLKKFTTRMHCNYLGTVIKGGVEGIQVMPPSWTKKLFNRFKQLGEEFATSGNFSAAIKEALGKPFVLPPVRLFLIKIISKTKLANMYWDNNLKKNNAYIKRFDKPFTNNLYLI
jgi:NAD(P)H-dependent FMN reductase